MQIIRTNRWNTNWFYTYVPPERGLGEKEIKSKNHDPVWKCSNLAGRNMKSDQRAFDIIQERNFVPAKKSVKYVLSKNNCGEE